MILQQLYICVAELFIYKVGILDLSESVYNI
jgi:hypothetical protein